MSYRRMSKRLSLAVHCLLVLLGGPVWAAEVSPSQQAPSQETQPILELVAAGERRSVSFADIESLPLFETTLQHFEGPRGRFTGVWLDDFLAAHGLETTPRLRLIAHDDYTVFLTHRERQEKRYLLATRLDGEPLTLQEFGPTLLLVPADAEAIADGDESMARWIWSIREIRTP